MTSEAQTATRPAVSGVDRLRSYILELFLVGMVLVLVLAAPGFASVNNLLNVLRAVSMLGIIAFGMTAVIIAGEIDLSVGAGVALAGCIIGWVCGALTPGLGPWPAVAVGAVVAIIVGALVGTFTGKMRQWFNVPSFITTLALLTALRGIANLISGGFPIATFPKGFNFLGAGNLWGIPTPVFFFLAVFAGMSVLMKYTSFGRAIYAVGGNPEASRLSGIDVYGTKTLALAITGALTALSGILVASQIGSGNGTAATGMELNVIAAVIIGGTSLFGGKGRIWGTLLGVLFLGCINNGMVLMNVSEYWRLVVSGGIILAAVLLNQVLERGVKR
ncbi:ABC transporter permease [Devosia sp. CN2-171]|jgi:ribose/xylose/arabinose/galactoside ABC-type transport system permease subunit|uniref:ABC transporter permease n=1 Tax=Devosia sp. CN2-171 TaxID=3400909 RepID=UPI003BF8B4C6